MQTEDTQEKEPEVISTVSPTDNMSKVKLSEFPCQKELMEKEMEARSRGMLLQLQYLLSFKKYDDI